MGETEGVIKYRLDFTEGRLPPHTLLRELKAWHQVCHRLGLVGQHPRRYEGYAYGNISRRADAGFVISGSQTAGKPELEDSDYAFVHSWNTSDNAIQATGPCRPSSEALTHAAIYDLDVAIEFVIHVHSPEIWQRRDLLQLKVTRPDITYGTPAMAREVGRLFADHPVGTPGVFAMPGHVDGIVAFGIDAAAAGTALTGLLARALAV